MHTPGVHVDVDVEQHRRDYSTVHWSTRRDGGLVRGPGLYPKFSPSSRSWP